MAQFTVEKEWERWAGTVAELVEVVEMALESVKPWATPGIDTDKVQVTVKQRELTMELDSSAELKAVLDPRDLKRTQSVAMDVGRPFMQRGVRLLFSSSFWGPALELRVVGDDRDRVEGLAKRLAEHLEPRQKLGFRMLTPTSGLWVALIAWFVSILVLAFVARALDTTLDVRRALVVGGSFLIAALFGALALVPKTGELLAPGQRPRFVRWRKAVVALIVTVVLGIGTSIVATAIYSG
jgi:hypothetical protein